MRILRYKKITGNKYEVELENGEKIKLYEDVILKEELLLKKEINDISLILKENSSYEIYDTALKRLSHHSESLKGMREFLKKKGYDEQEIDKSLDKLVKNNYLNDQYYAKCYILNQINLSNDGPLKIKKHLDNLDIPFDVYSEYFDYDDSIWYERIKKYLNKNLKSNKKSPYVFKNKMFINLINLGYEREMINDCLNKIVFDNQDNLREKEQEKIRTKLSKKYHGEELERKIKEKLYMKGFFE